MGVVGFRDKGLGLGLGIGGGGGVGVSGSGFGSRGFPLLGFAVAGVSDMEP